MARVTPRANGRGRTPAATPNSPSASHLFTGRGASIPFHGNAGRTFTALKRIFCRPSKPSRNRFRERPAVEQDAPQVAELVEEEQRVAAGTAEVAVGSRG